jgi:hypothetical protein
MIVFDLVCEGDGHVFEAWFGSSADYEDQRGRGLVACPICNSAADKAPMAPRVAAKGNAAPSSAEVKAMMTKLASMQKEMLASSEHVGDRFPDEARAIHLGEAEARAIHGRATPDQAKDLADDGVPVAPLPFPVIDPDSEN